MNPPTQGRGEWSDKAQRREAEARKREAEREERIAANRARRGDPQRFTLRGPKHIGQGEDSGFSLEEIDPPLEWDEELHVVLDAAYPQQTEGCQGPPGEPGPLDKSKESNFPQQTEGDEREWMLESDEKEWTLVGNTASSWQTVAAGPSVERGEEIPVVPKSRFTAAEQRAEKAEEASDAYEKERDWLEGKLKAAQADKDRLQRELEIAVGELGQESIRATTADAERDRLQRELHHALNLAKARANERIKVQRENERLREALDRIARYGIPFQMEDAAGWVREMRLVARQVLEGQND